MPSTKLPHRPSIPIEPFTVNVPQEDLDDLHRRLADVKPLKKSYESCSRDDAYFGVNHAWMSEAIRVWRDEYDWCAPLPFYTASRLACGATWILHLSGVLGG